MKNFASQLPVGGYVCKIVGTAIETTKTGKEMLCLRLDIAEGTETGFFDNSGEKKPIYRQVITDDTGQVHRFFKGLLLMIVRSNPDYAFDPAAFDARTLEGKLIGMVFAEEHYQKRDGSDGVRVVPKFPKNIEDIRNGNFTIPEQKNNAPVNADVIPITARNDSTPATDMQSDFDSRADSAASSSSELAQLQAELATVNAEMKAFETERDNAFETLKNLQQFGHENLFDPDIIRAAAICDVFDGQTILAGIQHEAKNFGELHPKERANLNNWRAAIKATSPPFAIKRNKLETRKKNLIATIKTIQFAEQCADTKVFAIPTGFYVDKTGVWRLQVGNKPDVVVARRPVYFVGRFYNVDDQIHSVQLAVMDEDKKLHKLPLVDKATTADRGKIIALANHGLPVSSATATELVGYLDALYITNESRIPMSYLVNRCGWHKINGAEIFVDPRRDCTVSTETGKNIPVVVDNKSQFAKSLTQAGSLDEWQRAYSVAKKSPVARLIVAACVAAPLLKILGERNFMLYIHAKTRAGKTTALMLGASAVGSEKIVRSFDATKNGLIGAAADVNDYAFLVDEKQVADNRIKEQLDSLVYALANGIGRTKLNRDSSNRKVLDWRTIAVATGETEFLDDNATGGAHTRLLSIKAPETILSAEDCKTIRQTIADNYGHAMPLCIDKIIDVGKSTLIDSYNGFCNAIKESRADLLSEHCRYLALLLIADDLLNSAIGDPATAAIEAANAVKSVLPFVPTIADIDDTARERDFVLNFVAENQNKFLKGKAEDDKIPSVYGKFDVAHDFVYIIAGVLKSACDKAGFDFKKLVADLVADGFFIPDAQNKSSIAQRIGAGTTRCYRYRQDFPPGYGCTPDDEVDS